MRRPTAAHVNDEAFEDVLSAPKKQPSHTAGFEQMSIRAFEQLADKLDPGSLRTPHPLAYMTPRPYCATAWPCSARTRNPRVLLWLQLAFLGIADARAGVQKGLAQPLDRYL